MLYMFYCNKKVINKTSKKTVKRMQTLINNVKAFLYHEQSHLLANDSEIDMILGKKKKLLFFSLALGNVRRSVLWVSGSWPFPWEMWEFAPATWWLGTG